ncbi:hypothetical protein E8E14_008094 [Neopestalotiopsis sp. 37M]|nr:hypothetical protein E8E14_008094 [Neopestalotiopsis sp. 37M]
MSLRTWYAPSQLLVVSVPTDQYPGVVQWDLGKAEPGRSFRRTGALNNTPTFLLTALTRLETDHDLQGTKIPYYMEQLQERYPRMAAQYLRSNDMEDVLFRPNYEHVDQQYQDSEDIKDMEEESESDNEDNCRHCDRAQVVKRKPRDMRVHYGLIASGNQVIKDARTRDQLSTDLGRKVLCIDMEAAGLMDGFPCLVIRGICDYADSHKNKAWQKHAAAVAAAFAKELLAYVIADEVSGEKPASALLDNKSMIASLLTQFSQSQHSLPDYVRSMYERHKKKGTQPAHKELLTALERMVSGSGYERTFIVLDALDECTSQDRANIMSDIKALQEKSSINILATSRPHDEIATLLMGENTTTKPIVAHNQDMDIMLQSRMKTFDQEVYDDKFRERIVSKIIQAAEGMFLLADLHLNALTALPTKGDILEALDNLDKISDPLDAVYELAMKRIESQDSGFAQLAKRAILWIVHARRRISTAEIQHALAIRPNTDAIDTNYCPTIGMVQSICAGLVIVDEDSDTVRLVHYTTQEYFEKARENWFPLAHDQISQSCVTYLSFKAFDGCCKTDAEMALRHLKFPFYAYACKEWAYHAQLATSKEHVLDFLRKEHQVQAAIQTSVADYDAAVNGSRLQKSANGLHLASRSGLETMVKALLVDYHVNVRDSNDQTPLSWAASEGHGAVIELLLTIEEVDINLPDSSGRTPLSKAAGNGHEHVIELLLRMASIDVNRTDQSGRSPLSWAALNGHRGVVHLLLHAEKIDINRKDSDFGQTPLSLAAGNGHEAVVELLLCTDDVDAGKPDNQGETPLSWAASLGNEAIVELLLFKGGIDIDSPDHIGRTPLSWAASLGHINVVERLLGTESVNVNLPDNQGRTPLSLAVSLENGPIVELFLSKGGIDIGQPDQSGRTPLSWAASFGRETALELLLSTERANINLPDKDGRTALSWAASNGHETAVALLSSIEEIDINLPDNYGRSPLSWAALNGHQTVVELLLGADGVNINLPDNYGRTPLSWAASTGLFDIVRLILSTGKADINFPDFNGLTPLSWAIESGWDHVVNELIDASKTQGVLPDFL